MRLLLDTNILIWFVNGSSNIPQVLRDRIEYYEVDCYISVESLREIAIKGSEKGSSFLIKGGLEKLIENIENNKFNFRILNTSARHVAILEKLSCPHSGHTDPFDRLIISQGIAEKMVVVSADTKFPLYKDKGFELLPIKLK